MVFSLLAVRQAILITVAVMMQPVEFVFDAIEAELERRGVEL